mgnify:FL=1
MILDILTPTGALLSAEQVSAVFLPGTMGEFEVLASHAPIISTLQAGQIRYRTSAGEQVASVASGFVIVDHDHIQACIEQ